MEIAFPLLVLLSIPVIIFVAGFLYGFIIEFTRHAGPFIIVVALSIILLFAFIK